MKVFSKHFISFLLLLIISFFTACGGGSSNALFKDSKVSPAVIGPEGGAVRSADGQIRIVIPAGALTENTEISLEPFDPDIEETVAPVAFYQALPDGLVFAVPATLEADVTDIQSSGAMPLLLSASNEFGAEILANQEVEQDLESGQTIARGAVAHFSTFTLGVSSATAAIDGVPFSNPANSPFPAPVVASVEINQNPGGATFTSIIADAHFFDSSTAPVFVVDSTPVRLRNDRGTTSITPFADTRLEAQINYRCGDPGVGTFRGTIRISGTETIFIRSTREELVFALTPTFFLANQEVEVITSRTIPFNNAFTGKRVVNCAGASSTPEPTVNETPTETPEATATPTTETTPEPTAGEATPDPTVVPTAVLTADLSVAPSALQFSHSVGSTGCPQDAGVVTVKNNGTAATRVNITISTGALSADTASFVLAPDETRLVKILFTCSQSTSFSGTVTFTPVENGAAASVQVEGNVG